MRNVVNLNTYVGREAFADIVANDRDEFPDNYVMYQFHFNMDGIHGVTMTTGALDSDSRFSVTRVIELDSYKVGSFLQAVWETCHQSNTCGLSTAANDKLLRERLNIRFAPANDDGDWGFRHMYIILWEPKNRFLSGSNSLSL